ncbi:MAG: proline--tRNA ligase [Chloroflexota bacterium]|nr:proline--tRNA ligase [Chloroflexota bacterium]MDE2970084.1 proline--tRNA ligase [Chloroflexota bacterium]
MRLSQFLAKTLRDDPAEAETANHRLMLRTGMIQQIAAGVYSYAPLALRSLAKVETIVREEMNAAGGQEVKLPALQPRELWVQTGRDAAFGPDLLRLKDRRERDLVIAPTHEEAVTLLVKQHLQSYRDLPQLVYQIQTKFRDEPRPRGGLVRVREFDMKDAYSFDADAESLDETYQRMVQAYRNIFRRCGIPAVMIEADSGAIGGKDSHEFIMPTEIGEDTFIQCPDCGYAANAERAAFQRPPAPAGEPLPVEEVHTPGLTTIAELVNFLSVTPEQTLKAVFYVADGEMVFVSVRGDLEVNEVKLKRLLGANDLHYATDEEVEAAGLVAGSASAVGLTGVKSVADESVHVGANFVVGANRRDWHLLNANTPRDFVPDLVGDIALAEAGHRCLQCGGEFIAERGVEVGHVFKLGTFFSEALNATFLSPEGSLQPAIMGCYGIGIGRLLAATIEHNRDERGMRLPPNVSPFQVYLAALNAEDAAVAEAADGVYRALTDAGFETLYDDRAESAGVKFNDADLFGFPVRVVVSPRNLRQGVAEVKRRDADSAHLVSLEDTAATVKGLLAELVALLAE